MRVLGIQPPPPPPPNPGKPSLYDGGGRFIFFIGDGGGRSHSALFLFSLPAAKARSNAELVLVGSPRIELLSLGGRMGLGGPSPRRE